MSGTSGTMPAGAAPAGRTTTDKAGALSHPVFFLYILQQGQYH